MKIVGLQENHLADAGILFKDSFNDCGENWTIETSLDHLKENYNETFALAAIEGSTLLGFLLAMPITTEDKKWLFIDTVVVRMDQQKMGIGQLLWDSAMQKAKDAKLEGVRLLANPKFSSYSWYEKLGLEQTGWVELSSVFE